MGDVDRAISIILENYPTLLTSNPRIHFRLRCRQFIELVNIRRQQQERLSVDPFSHLSEKAKSKLPASRSTTLGTFPSSPHAAQAPSPSLPQIPTLDYGDVFEHQMEIDDGPETTLLATNGASSNVGGAVDTVENYPGSTNGTAATKPRANGIPATSTTIPAPITNTNINNPFAPWTLRSVSESDHISDEDLVIFGARLATEFEQDASRIPEMQRTLDQHFALIASLRQPPTASSLGHLLSNDHRATIAGEVNAAILEACGRSSVSSLEKVYAQTHVLLTENGLLGGPGAVVDDRLDLATDSL